MGGVRSFFTLFQSSRPPPSCRSARRHQLSLSLLQAVIILRTIHRDITKCVERVERSRRRDRVAKSGEPGVRRTNESGAEEFLFVYLSRSLRPNANGKKNQSSRTRFLSRSFVFKHATKYESKRFCWVYLVTGTLMPKHPTIRFGNGAKFVSLCRCCWIMLSSPKGCARNGAAPMPGLLLA